MQSLRPRTVTKRYSAQLAVVAGSLLATALSAQTPPNAATSAKAAAGDEDVVRLSTFNVSTDRDYGYRASNSIAATRTDTPIKDVPMNIQVFTKDLYDDLYITNQVELERYNAALVNGQADAHSDNPIQQQYNAFIFRGFVQNWGLRDGIRQYDPIDAQDLARVEVVKGPAAAMYGLSYAGGVMNSITKTVDFTKNFSSVRLTAASEGEMRATLDANYRGDVSGGKFGVRFNGAWTKSEDERAHSKGGNRSEMVNVDWAPFPNTVLRWVGETSRREKPNGLGYFSRVEQDATGKNLSNNSDIPLQILHPEIPWDWNWSNGRNMRSLDTTYYRGSFEQKIGEDLQITGYYQNQSHTQIDGQGWDANGSGGADSWEAGGGWITDPITKQETIQSGYSYRDWSNTIHAYGATGVYKLNLQEVKNTFTFGANVWSEKFLSRASSQTGVSPIRLVYPVKAGIPITIPYGPPVDLIPNTAGAYNHEDNSNDYYFAAWQAAILENRWKLNAAINRTNLKLVSWANANDQNPNITKVSKNSPMFGTVFDVTKEYSLFLVHSTSLFPSTDKNSFLVQMPPEVGKSIEGGVKFDVMDGKFSGTLSYYRINKTGGGVSVSNHENRDTARWDTMTADQRLAAFPNQTRPDLFAKGDVVPGGTQRSTGLELDTVIQATRAWQILVSYAHNDEKVVSSPQASQIGITTAGHIKDQFALLNKYTFSEGELKGLYVGLGYQHAGKQLVDYLGSGGGARYNPSTNYLEAFAGYRFKFMGYNSMVQLNAKNLSKQDEFVGWKATGSSSTIATQRYRVPVPMRFALTFGLDL